MKYKQPFDASDLAATIDAVDTAEVLGSESNPMLTVEQVMNASPPSWLIEGLLPERGMVSIFGPPGSFKSFVILDAAMSVAAGTAWGDRFVQGGTAVYVAAEGLDTLRNRVRGWYQRATDEARDTLSERMRFYPSRVNLLVPEEVEGFSADLRSYLPTPPSLIILDTLSRCIPGGNENAQEDMSLVVDAAQQWIDRFDCCVVLVHHTGHERPTRERGSSVLPAAVDLSWQVNATQADNPPYGVEMTNRKAKTGLRGGGRFYMGLAEVSVDEDNPRETSLVVEVGTEVPDESKTFDRTYVDAVRTYHETHGVWPQRTTVYKRLVSGRDRDCLRKLEELIQEGVLEADGKGNGQRVKLPDTDDVDDDTSKLF